MYNKKGFVILFGLLFMLCLGFAQKHGLPVYTYHSNGKETALKAETDSLLNSVLMLVKESDCRFRMPVADSLMKCMKDDCSSLEIKFDRPFIIRTKDSLKYKIDRILIPFDGIYSTDEKSQSAVIFLGNGKYFSGPLGNSNGIILRNLIRKLTLQAVSAGKF